MAEFKIHSSYDPAGDQPQAIEELVAGIKKDVKHQEKEPWGPWKPPGALLGGVGGGLVGSRRLLGGAWVLLGATWRPWDAPWGPLEAPWGESHCDKNEAMNVAQGRVIEASYCGHQQLVHQVS